LNHNFTINNELELNTGLAFGRTDFKNPFITNYEMRNEKNTAIQSKLIYSKRCNQFQLKWITGFEYLINNSSIQNYTNKNGVADSLLLNDAVKANQWFVFSQFNINYKKWNLQIGVSANEQWYGYERLNTVNTNSKKESSTKMITTPRVAISYKINKNISLYSIAAKGFSPPTLAEVKPSDGNF
jgi:iron complex outermembrane receptor protein